MKNTIVLYTAVLFISMNSCKNGSSEIKEKQPEEHGHHHEEEESNIVSLSEEQVKSIQLVTGFIEKKQLTASLRANGLLKVPNNNRANATALLGGVVKELFVQAGNTVQSGQRIATIANHSFIELQEEFITISAKVNLADQELKRQQELQSGNAGTLKNLQIADAEWKSLHARKTSLQKQLEIIGINSTKLTSENMHPLISITSPIKGVISNLHVNIGSYVNANNPIAEIVDNSQLHLDLYIYEKDLHKLKVGQTIHFTLTNNPGKEYDADVYAISNTFEKNTKAIAVHALVKGDKTGLIDGMSISALISLDNSTVDAVPSTSIVNYEGQDYIFVVHAEEHAHTGDIEKHVHPPDEPTHEVIDEKGGMSFEKIPIRKGTTDVGYSEITLLKEIPAGSRIVTEGAFFILAKMNNSGEGHSH